MLQEKLNQFNLSLDGGSENDLESLKRIRYYFEGTSFTFNLHYKLESSSSLCEMRHLLVDALQTKANNFIVSTYNKTYEPVDINHFYNCYLNKNVEYWIEYSFPIENGKTSRTYLTRLVREEYDSPQNNNRRKLLNKKNIS